MFAERESRGDELVSKWPVRIAVLFGERTGVDTDTNGNACFTRRVYDGVDSLSRADVARVDAEFGGAAPRCLCLLYTSPSPRDRS